MATTTRDTPDADAEELPDADAEEPQDADAQIRREADAGTTRGAMERGFPKVWSIRFPHGISFSVVSLLVCCLAAGAYAFARAGSDGVLAYAINEDLALTCSVLLYCFTLFCMFCALVYRRDLEDVPGHFGDDEEKLMKQWHSRS